MLERDSQFILSHVSQLYSILPLNYFTFNFYIYIF